jgi:DNA-binding transcriptional LysR family regulator
MLRIGLTDGLAQPRLSRLLARCREEEPRTGIWIIEMTHDQMVKAIDHEQIDVGMTIHPGQNQGIAKEAVWVDRPVIAVPRNHPLLSHEKISPREILQQTLILCHPEFCAGGYDVVRHWFGAGWRPWIGVYAADHESMLMFVAAGYGIGVGLKSQLALYRHPDVILRPVTDDVPGIEVFLATPDRPLSTLSDELKRFIERAR